MSERSYRVRVFVSYSEADGEWLERLQTHLKPYIRREDFQTWDDTQLTAGSALDDEVALALNNARVAVLLVSPDYLASDRSAAELSEVLRLLGPNLTLIWIPVRPSAYDETPLRDHDAAHDPTHPLSTLTPDRQDAALVVVAKKVARACDEIRRTALGTLSTRYRLPDRSRELAALLNSTKLDPTALLTGTLKILSSDFDAALKKELAAGRNAWGAVSTERLTQLVKGRTELYQLYADLMAEWTERLEAVSNELEKNS